MSTQPGPGPTRAAGSAGANDRRSFWIAGLVLLAAIVGLTAVSLVSTSFGPRRDTNRQLQEQGGAKPHIIPRPDEGQAPEHPNDRGGWQQFLVLGLIVVGIGGIGALAWRSSQRARRRTVEDRSSPSATGATRSPVDTTPPA